MAIIRDSFYGQLFGRVGSATFCRSRSGDLVRSAGRAGGLNNPQSQAQASHFSACVGVWRSLSRQAKSHWGQVGKSHRPPLSAYQAFISHCLSTEEVILNNVSVIRRTIFYDSQEQFRTINTAAGSFVLNMVDNAPIFLVGVQMSGSPVLQGLTFTLFNEFQSVYDAVFSFNTSTYRGNGFWCPSGTYPILLGSTDFYLKSNNRPNFNANFTFVQFDFYFLKIDVVSDK